MRKLRPTTLPNCVTVDRGSLTVAQADKRMCERRLKGSIEARPAGEHPDQGTLDGMDGDAQIDGVFDVKGFSISKDSISLGLTLALASVNVGNLAHFAKRSGKLTVLESEALPDTEKKGEDDGDDEEE